MSTQTTLPSLRVSKALRRKVESALQEGETLSAFLLDAVMGRVQERAAQTEFIARGLARSRRSKASGHYIAAEEVLAKLDKMLTRARQAKRRVSK